jgi:hypothetical protein
MIDATNVACFGDAQPEMGYRHTSDHRTAVLGSTLLDSHGADLVDGQGFLDPNAKRCIELYVLIGLDRITLPPALHACATRTWQEATIVPSDDNDAVVSRPVVIGFLNHPQRRMHPA